MKTSRKPKHQMAVKKSVSMPEGLFVLATQKANALGFAQFSDFVQYALRKQLLEVA